METLQKTLAAIPGLLSLNGVFMPVTSVVKLTEEQGSLRVVLCTGETLLLSPDTVRSFLIELRTIQQGSVNGEPKLLTYAQIAYRYQVEIRTVKSWVKARKLKAIKVTKRCVRFNPVICDNMLCS